MRILVKLGDELRQVDDERHYELIADGFRPVSGNAEKEIVSALFALRCGNEIYRRLKCSREEAVIRLRQGRFVVKGNDQVFYVKFVPTQVSDADEA